MKISQELKVGVFGIVSLVILYCGGQFLKRKEIFSNNNFYHAYVQNAEGLVEGQKIRLNGALVGVIKKIEFLPENDYQSKITFSINNKIKLNKNSYLNTIPELMGGKFLKLYVEEGEEIQDGDEIIFYQNHNPVNELTSQAGPLLSNVHQLVSNANTFIVQLNSNNENLKKTIAHLEQTTKVLNEAITTIAPQVQNLVANIADHEHGLNSTLLQLNAFSKKINDAKVEEVIANLNLCLKKVKDTPIWDNTNTAIVELQKTIKDLDKLFVDLRLHPQNYVHFSLWGSGKKSNIKNR